MTTLPSRREALGVLAAASAAGLAAPALAQAKYPVRPLRFLVPQAPGGGADLLVRTIKPKLDEFFGQPVIVDNKPGAGGNIGTTEGGKAPPDGYTLVFVNLSTMAINPHIYANPGFRVSDFVPVTNMASVTNLICVTPAFPARTLGDLLAMAREKPGTIDYGTAGNGSENHLMGELLKSMAGINLVHVPFRGGGPAVVAAVAGHVPVIVADPLSAISHVKGGTLRALAVTSAERTRAFPEVPTVSEAGVPGYEASGWRGLVLPKGTPDEIVSTVHKGVTAALRDPAVAERLSEQLYEPVGNAPDAFGRFIATENEKWSALIRTVGLKVD